MKGNISIEDDTYELGEKYAEVDRFLKRTYGVKKKNTRTQLKNKSEEPELE